MEHSDEHFCGSKELATCRNAAKFLEFFYNRPAEFMNPNMRLVREQIKISFWLMCANKIEEISQWSVFSNPTIPISLSSKTKWISQVMPIRFLFMTQEDQFIMDTRPFVTFRQAFCVLFSQDSEFFQFCKKCSLIDLSEKPMIQQNVYQKAPLEVCYDLCRMQVNSLDLEIQAQAIGWLWNKLSDSMAKEWE